MELYNLLTKANIYYDKNKVYNHLINKIENNSVNIEINDIFVAIKGEDTDGHDYIFEAIKKGAKTIIYEDKYYEYKSFDAINLIKVHDSKKALAILTNYFFDEPSKKINLVAVTGTNGKTTVTSMIYNLLRLINKGCTLIGTTGIKINEKELETINTTPSTLVINQVLNQSILNNISNVVMEVSSHAIKQQRVSQLDINTVIYTNFSHDHLDYHKTFDDYFYSKGLLFSYLGNYFNEKKIILNGDDKFYKKFIRLSNVKYYTYGINEDNDFQAKDIICDIDKIAFDFYYYNEFIGYVNTNNIFGFFNVYNLLAILTYFYINNYDMNIVLDKIQYLNCTKGRMQKVENKFNISVFIDYAHSPDSVYRVLNEIKMISKKNIICVVGCGGNRDKLKRSIIGKITTSIADYVIFTSDNPRFEDPNSIINDIVKGACNNNYICIENRKEAIKYAIDTVGDNDVVVVLGKGHENYQVIKDKRVFFSDYDEVTNSLNTRFSSKL